MHMTITRRASLVLLVLIMAWTGSVSVWAGPDAQSSNGTPAPPSGVIALVVVERAIVFPAPDRTAAALTYLYERERVPVFGQSGDGVFLLVQVGAQAGWILRAQVDLEGDAVQISVVDAADGLSLVTPSPTFTPFPTATRTPSLLNPVLPTATPLINTSSPSVGTPTQAPVPTVGDAQPGDGEPTLPGDAQAGGIQVLPGVAPPLEITLPQDWEAVDLVVPMQNFDGEVRDIPLTIYFGALDRNVYGLVYLYWGFPNTVDWASGEYNLWADGVQILRGSLVGQSCNLGVYDQQMFTVGEWEGVGANYQASNCTEEADTAGWFATVRVNDLTYAFFTAVEPWDALMDYRPVLQAILDTVEFVPVEDTEKTEQSSP